MSNWRNISIPNLLLLALTLAIVATGTYAAGTSTATFSVYNSGWDGTSDLRSTIGSGDTEVDIVHETSEYASVPPSRTVAFVLSPDSAYRPNDAVHLSEFVRNGGTLVVADDFGPHGNDLLRKLSASSRFDGRLLRDAQSNYRSTAMPIAMRTAGGASIRGSKSITLNHGTAVRPNGATTLFNTSDYAYLDTDGDGNVSENETLTTYSVATEERIGSGRVIVVGDSSVFINAMLERPGNRKFARSLADQHAHALLDVSQTERSPALVRAVLAVRDSAALQLSLGWFVAVALVVWSRRPEIVASALRRWDDDVPDGGTIATRRELIAHLERRHPDWNHERVERVVSALDRRRDR